MSAATIHSRGGRKSLEFPHCDTRSPQQARRWLARELTRAHVPAATIEACESVVSELATNAGQHVGGRILVSEQITERGVEVSVFDTGHVPPAQWAGPGGLDDERGRGSVIVSALADEVTVTVLPSGKTVRALIAYSDAEQD